VTSRLPAFAILKKSEIRNPKSGTS